MNTLRYIRKQVFGVTQREFAEIASVQQSMVSRWENGVAAPTLEEMQRIRAAAAGRRLKSRWNDRLFFDAPPKQETAA